MQFFIKSMASAKCVIAVIHVKGFNKAGETTALLLCYQRILGSRWGLQIKGALASERGPLQLCWGTETGRRSELDEESGSPPRKGHVRISACLEKEKANDLGG